jgi:thiamine-monophosphate kinase
MALALGGGEDYELCFTARIGTVQPHADEFAETFGVQLRCVGRAAGGDGVWWVDAEGNRRPLGLHGYRHFGEDD